MFRKNLDELPAELVGDQQVLRLADGGAHTAERRAHRAVHQQRAQEGAELLQVLAVMVMHALVVAVFVFFVVKGLARCHLVIDAIEADGDADDHRGHGQRIEKGRQKGGHRREQHGKQGLGANAEQNLGEGEQQQLLHEENARHHEHQQQDDREVAEHFHAQGFRRGHAQYERLDGQQASRLQRIAAQRHGQGEDEFQHQHPARDEGPGDHQEDGIDCQEGDDGQLVPARRVAEKVLPEGVCRVDFVLLESNSPGWLPTVAAQAGGLCLLGRVVWWTCRCWASTSCHRHEQTDERMDGGLNCVQPVK